MLNMWFLILLALGKISICIGFNVDTENPIIFEPNMIDQGLFGHGIALTKDAKLIVGAPLSKTHGALFSCSNSNPICTRINGENHSAHCAILSSIFAQKYLRKCEDTYFILQNT